MSIEISTAGYFFNGQACNFFVQDKELKYKLINFHAGQLPNDDKEHRAKGKNQLFAVHTLSIYWFFRWALGKSDYP